MSDVETAVRDVVPAVQAITIAFSLRST